MRALPLAILLAAAACGEPATRTTVAIGSESRLLIRTDATDVEVTAGEAGALQVVAEGAAGLDLDACVKSEKGTVRIEPEVDFKRLKVTAPAGLDLAVITRGGNVKVRGGWRELAIATVTGRVDAVVERADSGTVSSAKGDISLTAARGPTGDFACKSTSGDVAVTMPSTFRGRVHISTQTGTVEVPEHKGLRAIWEPSRKGVLAFVGKPLTEKEREQELAERASPRAIWISSASGRAAFFLQEHAGG